MIRIFLFFILVLPSALKAQDLSALEDSVAHWHSVLAKAVTDDARFDASDHMKNFLQQAFTQDGVFDYPFTQLNFSTITSSDGRVRLFNWNQPLDNGANKYYCYVLEWNSKSLELSVTELLDAGNLDDNKMDQKYLSPDKWYGALYYDIIPMEKSKTNDTYTLLGWEGKDRLSTCKVMDAITVKNGKVRLGAPIFNTELGMRKRIIYEYNAEVSMSLKYEKKKKHIVMDHLSPLRPLMTGIYSEYGPDGSYDRFVLDKGKWNFESNVDVSIYGKSENRPYTDPRK